MLRLLWVRHLGWQSLVLVLAVSALGPGCGSGSKRNRPSSDSGGAAGAAGAAGEGGARSTTGSVSSTTTSVMLPVCGDGQHDTGEACDDGNNNDRDGCSAGCELERPDCGNGERAGEEECDDGNLDNGDGCDAFCQAEQYASACGDGEVQDNEGCDDANLLPGDGCNASCQGEACGNDRVDAGEECDPPVTNHCSTTCLQVSPNCGDGQLQADESEQCDDGNDEPADGCHECRITCGNGRVDGAFGEDCEQEHSPATCSESCHWLPVCGDGLVDATAGEECDPANGVTCVECKTQVVDPPNCDDVGNGGTGGASPSAEECPPIDTCVPHGEPGQLAINGTFATDASGWTPHSNFISLNPVSEGVPEPLALEIGFGTTTTRSVSGAFQCLPITPGSEYDLTADYLIPADAPSDLAASVTVLLYAGTACEGTWVRPPGNGPNGRERGVWTPYEWLIDTSTLLSGGEVSEGRMLLRLNVAQPADVTGSRIVWDNVSLTESGSLCGDCIVDEDESCDDGNQTAGDGCSPLCALEICGNGQLEGAEECDDGDNVFNVGEACTPACSFPSTCDTCALTACSNDPAVLEDCWSLTGDAEEGPAAGTARSQLCAALRSCVHETACDQVVRTTEGVEGPFLENCYCGTAGAACFDSSGEANGSCKAEIEAALETDDAIDLAQRMSGSDPDYPIFANLKGLLVCEQTACADCLAPSRCGDGQVQDRNFDFVFEIDREDVPCRDDLTDSGRGCSFEECDDGNLEPGDGCDQYCFVEACGNHVMQAGETCDDGNTDALDGCDNCQAQHDCGNSEVEISEECDPPGEGLVCSLEEYETDSSQCGCDAECSYTVCGNGVLQAGEQCDPPGGGICDDECQLVGGGPCEDCIQATPYLGEFSTENCDTDPRCFAVKRCVLSPIERDDGYQTCYFPLAAECYCGVGVDLDDCEQPTFVPTGPCVDEIRAGLPPELDENSLITSALYDYTQPTGVAMLIAEEARTYCPEACGLLPPAP